jgi:NTE family protein
MDRADIKRVNLALQGGGAIEGLTATSSASTNAVVYAYGRMRGGLDGAREALEDFFRDLRSEFLGAAPIHPAHVHV